NSGNLTINNCQNGGSIQAYRGLAGGIAGFARNAQINSCTNYGSLGQNSTNSNNSAYKGQFPACLPERYARLHREPYRGYGRNGIA
ncbi:MAG: hypothetical protein IIV88_04105, partial [Erysipelotrichaceae bacterium]|nr:hypothetical protein [Erysipelotrichaceae bacterium]